MINIAIMKDSYIKNRMLLIINFIKYAYFRQLKNA
jgi:hypothetical protein